GLTPLASDFRPSGADLNDFESHNASQTLSSNTPKGSTTNTRISMPALHILIWLILVFPATLSSLAANGAEPQAAPPPGPASVTPKDLPFVYTQWKHFTVKEGLPNDHVFAVKVDGPRVWIGTEDGLAQLDKRTGAIRSWREKDGLPWRVITAIDVDKKTGDVWLGLFGG